MAKKVALLAMAVLFFSYAALAQEQFPLKPQAQTGSPDSVAALCAKGAQKLKTAPSNLKGAPGGLTDGSFYCTADLGPQKLLLLLDPAVKPMLYADANSNLDLGDDQGIAGKIVQSKAVPGQASAIFGPFAVSFGDKSSQVLVEAFSSNAVAVYPASVMIGDVKFGIARYRVAIVDANFDGVFDGIFPGKSYGPDLLAIDMDRNGTFDVADRASGEIMGLPKMVCIQKAYYEMKIAPDGSSVTVSKAQPKFGTLDALAGASPTFWSENGVYKLSGSKGGWQLPVGTYMLAGLDFQKSDRMGTWSMHAGGSAGATFAVAEGNTATLNVGPPFKSRIDVANYRDQVLIGLVGLVGRGGEAYPITSVKKSGANAPLPKLKILDESGKVLATGAFEYG